MKKIREFLMAQLKQGTSPRKLAASCAVGVICGCFPLFGTTTLLGVGLGIAFRLNQPALQAVNYLMAVPQILMIPVLVYLGETIFRAEHVSLNPATFAAELYETPMLFLSHYGWAAAYATFAWCLVAPIIFYVSYFLSRLVFEKTSGSFKKK